MSDSFSVSNALSRDSIYESFSMVRSTMEDAASQLSEGNSASISNEQIQEGDELLETYRVEDDAISGGMGSVWRVHHRNWDIDLAMKRPQPRFFSEGSDRRKEEFIGECENWIDLGLHPNIVSCYYVRLIGGVPTIFSEWMDGGSLKDVIRDGSLYEGSEKEAGIRVLDIAIQMARGLMYSHEKGLVHQDIKPGNILLTKEWEAKVADFGLAKASSRLSQQGVSLSSGYTLEYCPQEQAAGAEAEAWMDMYAWALTVLEMYCGKRVWEKGASVKDHCREMMEKSRLPIPSEVGILIEKCISEKEKDISEVLRILMNAFREVSEQDYPRPEPEKVLDTADSMNNRALSFVDLNDMEQAEKCWAYALSRDAAHLPSLYNQGLYLWRKGKIDDEELVKRLSDAGKTDSPLAGTWLSALDKERGLESTKAYSQKYRTYGKPGMNANTVISPDGKTIVTVCNGMLQGWNVETGECLYSHSYGQKKINSPGMVIRMSPDGRFVVFSEKKEKGTLFGRTPFGDLAKMLYVAEASTGKILHVFQAHQTSVTCICFDPKSEYVYSGAMENSIRKWDLKTGKCMKEYPTSCSETTGLSVSSDGRNLYAVISDLGKKDGQIIRIDEETKEVEQIRRTGEGKGSLAISPDEKILYYCADRKLLKLNRENGEEKEVLLPRGSAILRLSCHADKLALSDGQSVKVLDAGSLRCLTTIHVPELYSASVDASFQHIVASTQIESDMFGLCMSYCLKEAEPAPWEICVIKSYQKTTDARKEWEEVYRQAESAIENKDAGQAVLLYEKLREKIEDGSQAEMLVLCQKLSKICAKKELSSIRDIRIEEIPSDLTGGSKEENNNGEKRAYSQDRRLVFIGKENGDLILQETDTRSERFRIPSKSRVLAVAISPDAKTAVVSNVDKQLIIIDIVNRKLARKTFPYNGTSEFLFFSPEGKRMYSLSKEYSLVSWETGEWNVADTHSLVRSLTGKGISASELAEGGRWLAYSEAGGENIKIRDLHSKVIREVSVHVPFTVTKLYFAASDNLLIASGGKEKQAYELVWKWDV